jgi:hypothetical protein
VPAPIVERVGGSDVADAASRAVKAARAHKTARASDVLRIGVSLSMKTSFRGPLVVSTVVALPRKTREPGSNSEPGSGRIVDPL